MSSVSSISEIRTGADSSHSSSNSDMKSSASTGMNLGAEGSGLGSGMVTSSTNDSSTGEPPANSDRSATTGAGGSSSVVTGGVSRGDGEISIGGADGGFIIGGPGGAPIGGPGGGPIIGGPGGGGDEESGVVGIGDVDTMSGGAADISDSITSGVDSDVVTTSREGASLDAASSSSRADIMSDNVFSKASSMVSTLDFCSSDMSQPTLGNN